MRLCWGVGCSAFEMQKPKKFVASRGGGGGVITGEKFGVYSWAPTNCIRTSLDFDFGVFSKGRYPNAPMLLPVNFSKGIYS